MPERLRFHTRTRRSADWHVSIVVDVSGSMEASTIYSAVIAAILNGLPALSTRFVAFSTEVVDLTHRVDDPLGLLLEVSIGGGTNIGAGLRYARERLAVPSRTIIALVTDFEEGVSVGGLLAEVRALAESGAHLLGLAALDDRGQPDFNRGIAAQVAAAETVRIEPGADTVQAAGQLSCSCLLGPRCVHLLAVAAALDLAEDQEAVGLSAEPEPDEAGRRPPEPDRPQAKPPQTTSVELSR